MSLIFNDQHHTSSMNFTLLTVKSNLMRHILVLHLQIVYVHGDETAVAEAWTICVLFSLALPPQDKVTENNDLNFHEIYFRPKYIILTNATNSKARGTTSIIRSTLCRALFSKRKKNNK